MKLEEQEQYLKDAYEAGEEHFKKAAVFVWGASKTAAFQQMLKNNNIKVSEALMKDIAKQLCNVYTKQGIKEK